MLSPFDDIFDENKHACAAVFPPQGGGDNIVNCNVGPRDGRVRCSPEFTSRNRILKVDLMVQGGGGQ
jgi:hypothetical protein